MDRAKLSRRCPILVVGRVMGLIGTLVRSTAGHAGVVQADRSRSTLPHAAGRVADLCRLKALVLGDHVRDLPSTGLFKGRSTDLEAPP